MILYEYNNSSVNEWLSDCCLTPIQQFFSYIRVLKMCRWPAISQFTFTFSPVKNLSSMGFPTIFMFIWTVVITFCWSISSYRLLLLLQSTAGINVCVTPDLHSVPFPKVKNLESSLHFHRLTDYVPVHKQRKISAFFTQKGK